MPEIRELTESDRAEALALNNAAVPAVNGHDRASFAALLALAERAWVADTDRHLAGLLVGFGAGSPYRSLNYRWLSARYDDFAYVDRVVVSPDHRRQGIGALLYEALADHARALGRCRLLCEVNVAPPNPVSIAFHQASGWAPVGDLEHTPGKVVRFFERLL